MKFVAVAALALPLLAATPAAPPLVAGSIRDQLGAPIADADIALFAGSRLVGDAVSGADGTFALDGDGDRVEIRCRYCRARSAPVVDGLVTAIVQRYQVLMHDGPSDHDIESLAGAPLESLLEVTPFVVVNTSSRALPGTSASDRNATPYGGLLVVDGTPDYDPNAGLSTFTTVPSGGVRSLEVERTDESFEYGNLAQGGTFVVDTTGGASAAASGSGSLLRYGSTSPVVDSSVTYSQNAEGDRRARAAASAAVAMPGSDATLVLSSGDGNDSPTVGSALGSSFSSVAGTIESRSPIDTYANVVADRGTYAYPSRGFPQNATWSDTQMDAGARSRAAIAPFVDLSMRASSGSYAALADTFAQTVTQARATTGVRVNEHRLDALLVAGRDDVAYRGVDSPLTGAGSDASASAGYDAGKWRFEGSVDSGYTLQTLLGSYQSYGTGLSPVEQGTTNEATLSFDDGSRVRTSLTALRWTGASGVRTSSAGASVSWQIAPALSLRTWMLDESSTVWPQAWVGSAWLTYETGAFRVDAIWARSLLDRAPYGHLDGTISGRLGARLRWFLSTQTYERRHITLAGLTIR